MLHGRRNRLETLHLAQPQPHCRRADVGGQRGGCDELSRAQRHDDPASALNTKTSKWGGSSSDGSYSSLKQVSTGKKSFVFTETCYKKGPEPIETTGSGRYEDSNGTNIYTYTKPQGVVVVRTEESLDEISTMDTVINTTIPLFKVGEQVTYTVRE